MTAADLRRAALDAAAAVVLPPAWPPMTVHRWCAMSMEGDSLLQIQALRFPPGYCDVFFGAVGIRCSAADVQRAVDHALAWEVSARPTYETVTRTRRVLLDLPDGSSMWTEAQERRRIRVDPYIDIDDVRTGGHHVELMNGTLHMLVNVHDPAYHEDHITHVFEGTLNEALRLFVAECARIGVEPWQIVAPRTAAEALVGLDLCLDLDAPIRWLGLPLVLKRERVP